MRLRFVWVHLTIVLECFALVANTQEDARHGKFIQLKKSIRKMWAKPTSTLAPQGKYFVLDGHNLPPKYYKPEPIFRNPNYTEVYPPSILRRRDGIDVNDGTHSLSCLPNQLNPAPYLGPFRMKQVPHIFNPLYEAKTWNPWNSENQRQAMDWKPSGEHRVVVLSRGEIDPLLYRRGNISLQIPVPLFLKRRKFSVSPNHGHPLIKRRSVITWKSYPQCFVVSEKLWPMLGKYEASSSEKNRNKRKTSIDVNHRTSQADTPYWPFLGAIGHVYLGRHVEGRDTQVSLRGLLNSKKSWQMDLIRRISEMKAKEHMAEDSRLTRVHKTQEAKNEFQKQIGDQMSLLSDAKRAELRAKKAFSKVLRFEKELSEHDKEIHRLKEAEDELYEELLESEAEVALADMEVIPRIPSEEELQNFLSGTRFVSGATPILRRRL